MSVEFLNKSKEDRARQVIAKPSAFPEESVERTSLAAGQKEELKGEALVEFIYRRIGGAVKGEQAAGDTKVGVISEETSGKEVEEVGRKKRKK
jgi:hypothetical protein